MNDLGVCFSPRKESIGQHTDGKNRVRGVLVRTKNSCLTEMSLVSAPLLLVEHS